MGYTARVVDHHKGTAMMWQCWNEPNYFWHVEGPHRYEQYAEVLQASYAICKALDPQADVIADGFAGSAAEFGKLAKEGAAGFTDAVPIHYPGARTITFDDMPLEGTIESKANMVRELAKVRDENYPGKFLINTEEGIWGMQNRTPEDGAKTLARMYVSQMAAGLDRLTWFECYSAEDPGYLLRGEREGPWPAYFAYATASAMLEDAFYVKAIHEGLTQVHAFSLGGRPVIVAWSMEGAREETIDVDAEQVTVTDWQGNKNRKTHARKKLTLRLTDYAQFITGASPTILARLGGAGKGGRPTDWNSDRAMDLNRLFYAARQAEILAHVQFEPTGATPADASRALDDAEKNLRDRCADGRYLRNAATALAIAKRSAYFMNFADRHVDKDFAMRLAPAVAGMARQVRFHAEADSVWYPGVMIRVALDTNAIRKEIEPKIEAAMKEAADRQARRDEWMRLRAAEAKDPAIRPQRETAERQVNADNAAPLHPPTLDEKFAPEVAKMPGDTVELEVTIYNWRRETIAGTVTARLPEGWTSPQALAYTIEPMQWVRQSMKVTIPKVAPGTYAIGAATRFKETELQELHPHRIKVGP